MHAEGDLQASEKLLAAAKILAQQPQAINFAKRVADSLDVARKTNNIYNILIIATPKLLGELRKQMTAEMVIFELDKDLTLDSIDEIRLHFPQFITH